MKLGQLLPQSALTALGTSPEKICASYKRLTDEEIQSTKETIVRMLRKAHIPGLQLEFHGKTQNIKEIRIPVTHSYSEKYILVVRDGSIVFSKLNSPSILTVTEFINKYTYKK